MFYIKNNTEIALGFVLTKNGREQRFDFDCLRMYSDTGNIATTGVTPIAEDDFDALYKENRAFKKAFDKGELVKTEALASTSDAVKISTLEKENAVLRAKLAEKTGKESVEKTSKEPVEETSSKKSALEALKKNKIKKEAETKIDESEGF